LRKADSCPDTSGIVGICSFDPSRNCIRQSQCPEGKVIFCILLVYEKFEDTKGVIRGHQWKKEKQHNDQKKQDERTDKQ